jgi:hypothetical protein
MYYRTLRVILVSSLIQLVFYNYARHRSGAIVFSYLILYTHTLRPMYTGALISLGVKRVCV